MPIDRSEAKYDDGGETVTFRASSVDILTVELTGEAFSVNWSARTKGQQFIEVCRYFLGADDAPSTVYSCTAQRYLHIPAGELFSKSWESDDLRFIRLDFPSFAVAWQHRDYQHDYETVGCAMAEFNLPIITGLFDNTASDELSSLTKELDEYLGFLRYTFKES
jgi:hypothetical protein